MLTYGRETARLVRLHDAPRPRHHEKLELLVRRCSNASREAWEESRAFRLLPRACFGCEKFAPRGVEWPTVIGWGRRGSRTGDTRRGFRPGKAKRRGANSCFRCTRTTDGSHQNVGVSKKCGATIPVWLQDRRAYTSREVNTYCRGSELGQAPTSCSCRADPNASSSPPSAESRRSRLHSDRLREDRQWCAVHCSACQIPFHPWRHHAGFYEIYRQIGVRTPGSIVVWCANV